MLQEAVQINSLLPHLKICCCFSSLAVQRLTALLHHPTPTCAPAQVAALPSDLAAETTTLDLNTVTPEVHHCPDLSEMKRLD